MIEASILPLFSSSQCRSECQFHDNPYRSGIVVYLSFPCERQASLECLVV